MPTQNQGMPYASYPEHEQGDAVTPPFVVDRRQACRLTANRQVSVLLPSGSVHSSTTNVSTGGLLLAPPFLLTKDVRLQCLILITELGPAQVFRADILKVDESGARVAFAPDQVGAAEAMRLWIESSVLLEIERRVGGDTNDTRDVIESATWHRQAGRIAMALRLFRAASETRPRGLLFQEQRARCLLAALEQPGCDQRALTQELGDTVEQGLALGASDLLMHVKSCLCCAEVVVTSIAPRTQREAEMARLRESIRRERGRLHTGFSHMLAETARLEALENDSGVSPDCDASDSERAAGALGVTAKELRGAARWGIMRRIRVPRLVASIFPSLALIGLLGFVPAAGMPASPGSPELRRVTAIALALPSGRAAPRSRRDARDTRCERGLDLLRDNQAALAVEQLQACVSVGRRSAEAYLALGTAQMLAGNEKKALAALDQFMALVPKHRDVEAVRALVNQVRRHRTQP